MEWGQGIRLKGLGLDIRLVTSPAAAFQNQSEWWQQWTTHTAPHPPHPCDRPVHGGAPDNPVQRPRGLEAPVLSASGSFIPRRSLDERHG